MADFNYSSSDVEIAPPPPLALKSSDVEIAPPAPAPNPVSRYGTPSAALPGTRTPFDLTAPGTVPSGFGGGTVAPAGMTPGKAPAITPAPTVNTAPKLVTPEEAGLNQPVKGPAYLSTTPTQTPKSYLKEPTNKELAQQAGEYTTGKINEAAPFLVGPFSSLASGPGHLVQGAQELAAPDSLREAAGGLGHVIQGGFETLGPAAGGAGLVAAPLATAATIGVGMAAQEGTAAALHHLGVAPEYADLAGDIAGIAAGYGVHAAANWWMSPKIPPEVRSLVEASQSAGPSGDAAANADQIAKITRLATHPNTPASEAAAARAMLLRKFGINIPEPNVAPETVPQQPEPEPQVPPPPQYNSAEFTKAHNVWNSATNKAATSFMEANPGVSFDEAKQAVAGTVGVEPTIDNYKAPPPPPEPPAPAPEVKPEPPAKVEKVSPATPNAPTAATPTQPEAPETIALQMGQMGSFGAPVQDSQRKAVMFPGGQGMPDLSTMAGLKITHDAFGNVYAYRPDLIAPGEIHAAAKNNTLPEVLGGPMGMGAPDKANLQGPPVAVVGKAPDGTEAQTTVTDAVNLPQTVAATHAVTPPGGTVEVKTPDQALAERGGNGQPPGSEVVPSYTAEQVELANDHGVPAHSPESGAPGYAPVTRPLTAREEALQASGGRSFASVDPKKMSPAVRLEYDHFRDLLKQNDNLGFDTTSEAVKAILMHQDWADRWDTRNEPDLVRLGNLFGGWGQPEPVTGQPPPVINNSAAIRAAIDRGKEFQAQAKTAKPADRKRLLQSATEEFNRASALNDEQKKAAVSAPKPVTPQVPNVPGQSYVLPSFATGQQTKQPFATGKSTIWENAAKPSWWDTAYGQNVKEPWEVVRDAYVNRVKTDPQFGQTAMDYAIDWADGRAEAGADRRDLTQTKPLSSRESSAAAKKLNIDTSGYDLKTIKGRNALATAIRQQKLTNVYKEQHETEAVPLNANNPNLGTEVAGAPPADIGTVGPVRSTVSEGNGSEPVRGHVPMEGAADGGAETEPVTGYNGEDLRGAGTGPLPAKNEPVRKITGSADIPLSPAGEQQVEHEAATKIVKPLKFVISAPSERGTETAAAFAPHAVAVSTDPVFDGWARGAYEGQPMEAVKDEMSRLTMNPDEVPPGVSPISGEPGKSWNEMAKPMFAAVARIHGSLAPSENGLIVTSGGNLQAIDAWGKAGYPADFEFDHAAIAAQPYWSVTGKMFRLGANGLDEVPDNSQPGLNLTEHGETAFNSKGGDKGADVAESERRLTDSEADLRDARKEYERLDDLHTQVKDRTAREVSEVDTQEFKSEKPSEIEDQVRKHLILAGRKYEATKTAHDAILAELAKDNPLLSEQAKSASKKIPLPEAGEADDTLKASIQEVSDQVKQMARYGEEDAEYDPRDDVHDLKRNLKYLDEDIRDLTHADEGIMAQAKDTAGVARKVIESAESYTKPTPPEEPSAQTFRGLDRQVKVIHKNTEYSKDTPEGRRLRDEALELSDKMEFHRAAAVAEAQADIDRESAARTAKEAPDQETKRAIDAMRRIIDAYENGEQISQPDRNAYARYAEALRSAAVKRGLDVQHYVKSAGFVEKYWNGIPEQPKPEAAKSYEEKSTAAMPEQVAVGPNDGLSEHVSVTIPSKIAKEIVPLLKKVITKSNIPILNNFAIITRDGVTKIQTTDLEQAVTFTLPGKTKAPDSGVTLPISALENAVKGKGKEDLTIKAEPPLVPSQNGKANITVGSAESSAPTLAVSGYPAIPDVTDHVGTVSARGLIDAIEKTIAAVSKEESRFTLNGALLEFENGNGRMVATDGHRLSLQDFPAPGVTGKKSFLVPKRTLETIQKMFGKEQGNIVLKERIMDDLPSQYKDKKLSKEEADRLRTKYISFEKPDGSTVLIARRLTGNFPDYQRILPQEKDLVYTATLQREALLDLMKRVVALKSRSNSTALSFRKGQLAAHSDFDGNTVDGKIPAELTSKDNFEDPGNPRIGMNAAYVADAISRMGSQKVDIQLPAPSGKEGEEKLIRDAMIVRPQGDLSHTTVVMPMRDANLNFDDGQPQRPASSVTLGSGLGAFQPYVEKFYEQDIKPAAKSVSQHLTGAFDDMKKAFAPQTRGPGSRRTSGLARERGAEMDQRRDRAAAMMAGMKSHFYKDTPEQHGFYGLDEWNAIETGRTMGLSAVDRKFALAARTLLDSRRDEMISLGILKTYVEDYLPREYKNPEDASRWIQNWLSKRPMEGSKAFLRQRTYATLKEGLEDPDFTLVPKFDNPVDMLLSKLGQMDQAITAHRVFDEMHAKGDLKYVRAGQRAPVGWQEIDDKLFTVNGPRYGAVSVDPNKQERKPQRSDFGLGPGRWNFPEHGDDPHSWKAYQTALQDWRDTSVLPEDVRVEGQRIMGHYYAPEPIARVLNNHLSQGIDDTSAMKVWRGANNLMNMVQLSASYYHGLTTTLNSSFSDMALGIEQALNGRPLTGATSFGRGMVPFASVAQDYFKGTEIQKAWDMSAEDFKSLQASDPVTWAIVDTLKAAGGKARQDSYYQTKFWDEMKRAWETGNPLGAIAPWRVVGAAIETSMKPIMEKLVPRVKLGAFAKLAVEEMQHHPIYDRDQMREAFGQIWNSIDNRFGQLAQRNLLMHAYTRNVINAGMGRPGWNIGSAQELLGGLKDAANNVNDLLRGRSTRISHKTAYILALLIGGAMINGLLNWLMTGEMPKDWDYIAPQDGGITEDGRNSRIILPTYLSKDIYSYATRPWETLKAKAAPFITIAGDLAQNRNFYDQKIRNSFDPWYKQMQEVLDYMLKEAIPYSVAGLMLNRERNATWQRQIAPFVGVMPAGKRVGLSKAERLITEYQDEQRANTKTPAGVHNKAQSEVFMAAKQGNLQKAQALGRADEAKGTLAPSDVNRSIERARQTPLAADYKRVSDFATAMRIYDAATPQEKQLISREARNKVFAARAKAWEWKTSDGDPDTGTINIVRKYFPQAMPRPALSTPQPIQ